MIQTRSGLADESSYNVANSLSDEAHIGGDCETAYLCMKEMPEWDGEMLHKDDLDEYSMLLRYSAEFQKGCLQQESWIEDGTNQHMIDACDSWRSCLGDLASSSDYLDFLSAIAIEGSFNDLKEWNYQWDDQSLVAMPVPVGMWTCKCFENITSGCSTFESDDKPNCWKAEICKMKGVSSYWKTAAACSDLEDWASAQEETAAPSPTPTQAPTRTPTHATPRPSPRPIVVAKTKSRSRSRRTRSRSRSRRGRRRSLLEVDQVQVTIKDAGDDITAQLLAQRAEGAPPGGGSKTKNDVCQREGYGMSLDTTPGSKSQV